MGIILTKYGTSTDVVFGTSKFDYSYDTDDWPTVAEADVKEILLEAGDVYYFSRQVTTEDGLGNVITITPTNYRAFGMFQDITIKDRQLHDMGLAVPGNRKFYFMPSYKLTSGGVESTYEIKEGDIITDTKLFTGLGSTGQFRVVKILKQGYLPSNEIYRVAIVKNINLDGS